MVMQYRLFRDPPVRTRWISTLYRRVFRPVLLLYPLGSNHYRLVGFGNDLAMVARRLPYMEISSRNLMPAMVIFCIIDSPDIPLAVATRHQRTDDIANGCMSDIALFTTHS